MKKKKDTKTIHQKYAASMRLTKGERDRAYEFADSCGPALSASALYVKALKITLDLLQDPKKLKEAAPLSEELQELDTTNVPPTDHSVPLHNVMREDEIETSFTKEEILGNAPRRETDLFQVRVVLEE